MKRLLATTLNPQHAHSSQVLVVRVMETNEKDKIIMQLMEMLESQRADIEVKSKLIAEMESEKVAMTSFH